MAKGGQSFASERQNPANLYGCKGGSTMVAASFFTYFLILFLALRSISFFFFSFPFFAGLYNYAKGNKMPKKCRFYPNQDPNGGFSLKINSLDAVMLCFLKIYLAVDN